MSFPTSIVQSEPTGVYLTLADIASDSSKMSKSPIIVNDLDIDNISIKAKLNSMLYTYYGDTVVEMAPTCGCPPDYPGRLQGKRHKGKICRVCKMPVTSVLETDLEPHVWIRAPKGVDRLITPIAWAHLTTIFNKPSFSLIEWLVNPRYSADTKDRKTLSLIESIPEKLPNFERSMTYFYRHFDDITHLLLASPALRDKNKDKNYTYAEIKEYLTKHKNRIFTKYLPIPSRTIFIMEADAKKAKADPELFSLLDAVNSIAGKECPGAVDLKPKRANSIAVNIQKKLAEHLKPIVANKLGGKPGIYRQDVYGRRSHYTARGVLSSIHGKHDYRHIYIPWAVGMELFRDRIMSYLVKFHGHTTRSARRHFYDHVQKFDPVINEFFVAITSPNIDNPYSGETATNQRNPTLVRGASQLFAIAGVFTDPDIHTTAQSCLTFAIQNADLDGDALNLTLATDKYTRDYFAALKPHRAINDLNRPLKYNHGINLPQPCVATMVNFISHGASYQKPV